MKTTALETQTRPLAGAPWDEVTVGESMHPGVVVCSPEAPVRHAAWLMSTHRIHAVVALDDDEAGGLWGVVTDADVLAAAAANELDELTVGAVAQTPIVTVSCSDSLAYARELLHEHGVTHLLVTRCGRPAGVLSTLDLVNAAAAGVGGRSRR
jgi:CBS domain-containing protein